MLYDGNPVEIQTQYYHSPFYNIATDSLVVLQSEENKIFYEFQHLQQKLNIASNWLLQMMRLYPLPDPFHKQIEEEYFARYDAMDEFIKSALRHFAETPVSAVNNVDIASKIALAYYQPINPDWHEPDPWRDSIIALHYFDYFNPSDPFYLHTNIWVR